MIIEGVEQGTAEWHALRCGRVTASRVADIVRTIKGGAPSKMRATYLGEIVAERLSGHQAPGFTSSAMQHGKDTEEQAVATYESMRGLTVRRVTFVIHDSIDQAGASPDGLIGDDGQIEVKCPNSATHIETLLGEPVDPDYIKQMQWNLACTGRAWADFVSFDPRMPADLQLSVKRFTRDAAVISELEIEVRKFIADVDAKIDRLQSKYRAEAA